MNLSPTGTGMIFISHASADENLATQWRDKLRAKGYQYVFLTSEPSTGIPIGDRWETALYTHLRFADAIVFLLTEASSESQWCFTELAFARALGKPLLTLRRKSEALAHPLTEHLQAEEIETEGALERITRWLQRHVSLQRVPWPVDKCPFPGLNAYTEEFEPVFFGRRTATAELLEVFAPIRNVENARRVVSISGPSGSGKSSLVRAGIVGPLRRRPGWVVLPPFVPATDPMQNLASSLLAACENTRPELTLDSVIESLKLAPDSVLSSTLHNVQTDLGYPRQVVIVIDQFEELLTTTAAPVARDFLALLDGLVSGDTVIWLLVTIRSEYVSKGGGDNLLIDFLGSHHLNHLLMPIGVDRETLSSIIQFPALMAKCRIDPNLIDRVVEDMVNSGARGAALPLLAFTLQLSWEQMVERLRGSPEGRELTLEDYRQTGGLLHVVTERAEAALRRLTLVGCAAAVLPTLARFVVPSHQGERYLRRRIPVASLQGDALNVAREFETQRLIRVVDIHGEPAFEVTHEAVFDAWQALKAFLDEHAQAVADLAEVERRAQSWLAQDKPDDDLLRGAIMHRVAFLSELKDTPLLDEYVARSIAFDREFRDAVLLEQMTEKTENALVRLREKPRETLAQIVDAANACEAAGVVPNEKIQAGLYEILTKVRELHSQAPHSAAIRAMAVSKDGGIATGGDDHEIIIWKGLNDELPVAFQWHRAPITTLAFTPDGKMLVSAGEDGRLAVLHLADRTEVAHADVYPDSIIGVACESDNGRLVCLGESGRLSVWQMPHLKCERDVIAHRGYGCDCAAHWPQGLVYSAGADGMLKAWRLPDLETVRQVNAHDAPVSAIALTQDGERLGTGCSDGTIRYWNRELEPISKPIAAHEGYVSALQFAPDGHSLCSSGITGEVRQWRDDGVEIEAPLAGHKGGICDLAVIERDCVLLSGGIDRILRSWTLRGRLLREMAARFSEPVNTVCYLSDDVIAASADNRIFLISVSEGRTLFSWKAHDDYIWSLAKNPDGNILASASADATVRLWDLTGKPLTAKPLVDHEDDVIDITFTPDGRRIVSGGADGTIKIWRKDGHLEQRMLGYHDGQVNAVRCFGFGDDLRLFSAGNDGYIRLWNAKGKRLAGCKAHEAGVRSLVLNQTHDRIFSVGDDGRLCAWPPDLAQLVTSVRAHDGTVRRVIAGPGDSIFSIGRDGLMKRWTSNLAPFLDPIESHRDGTWAIDVSPDGMTLATGGNDGTVRVWRCGTWTYWLDECRERLKHLSATARP